MGNSASQAAAFYRDVALNRTLWTCCDEKGFPQPLTADGSRAQPFWSSLHRVRRVIKTVPAYRNFAPHELTWNQFIAEWVPDLRGSGVKVGVNWSGKSAIGYDVAPEQVVENVTYLINQQHPLEEVGS